LTLLHEILHICLEDFPGLGREKEEKLILHIEERLMEMIGLLVDSGFFKGVQK